MNNKKFHPFTWLLLLTLFFGLGAATIKYIAAPSGGSTDGAIVLWDGTSGLRAKNSVIIVDGSGNITGIGNLSISGILDVNEIDTPLIVVTNGIACGYLTGGTVTSTNGYTSGTQAGIAATVDVLVSGGTTNRLVFVGGILVTNIVNYSP